MVLVPPCVVPGTMVVKPFVTTCEEVISAERAEKFLSGGTKFSKVVPLLKNENDAVRLAKNALASI